MEIWQQVPVAGELAVFGEAAVELARAEEGEEEEEKAAAAAKKSACGHSHRHGEGCSHAH